MADINKFTTKEVLNKVLLDSSGNSVAAFSHTSQEALNAVLDSTNSRLNVSLVGGTISGDVTISGDLTVTGSTSNGIYDEIIDGNLIIENTDASSSTGGGQLRISSNDGATLGDNHRLGIVEFAAADDSAVVVGASIQALNTRNAAWTDSENTTDLTFSTVETNSLTEKMRIKSNGKVGIGTDSPDSLLELESSATTGHTLSMKGTSCNANVRLKLDFNGNDGSQGSKGYLQFNNSTNSIELQSASGKSLRFQTGGTTDRMILDDNSKISLANNDGGTGNTIFGRGTGGTVASGSNYNVLMGWDVANQGLNGGDFNVSIGTNSSRSLTSGSYNVAVGSNAHYNITTGHSNTAIGNSALYYNETGNYNVAIGRDSQGGADGNSHSNNTSVGYESLKAITTSPNLAKSQ